MYKILKNINISTEKGIQMYTKCCKENISKELNILRDNRTHNI